jgi:hypothetical protein
MSSVERLDHEVAVGERVRALLVEFVAIAVGIAREIQPVAAPALAIVRAGEELDR